MVFWANYSLVTNMTLSESQKIIDAVMRGIAVFSNLDADEISMSDNLEEDLFIDLTADLPRIIVEISKELEVELPRDLIADYKKQALAEPEEATVSGLVALFEEEVEFN